MEASSKEVVRKTVMLRASEVAQRKGPKRNATEEEKQLGQLGGVGNKKRCGWKRKGKGV